MQNAGASGTLSPLNTKHSSGIPCVTDCVMAELEKLGHRYRVALRFVLKFFSFLCLITNSPNLW